jgi:predicted permease
MSLWSRFVNVLRGNRINREIDEELESHLAEAVDRGRDPAEARRAFGSTLRLRESSRDIRLLGWLDSLRADAVFGWRQLLKKKVTSAAAVLSLALAIGACTSAFRLIDALLLRPLPVANPERLYSLSFQTVGGDGRPAVIDTHEYDLFRRMRAAVKDRAELIAASNTNPLDLTYKSDQEMEKAPVQFVSGWMFNAFGLRPAAGRLLTESDDAAPGAHPYAVLSYDYWTRRFGRDPKTIGRSFRMDSHVYTIVGVLERSFTGTQTGTVTGIFVPTTMSPYVTRGNGWLRILVLLQAGTAAEPVHQRLRSTFRAFREEWASRFTNTRPEQIDRYLKETLLMESAAAGVSRMQRDYRRPLIALGVLVALVLLIACANVANLMTAHAAARAREMALRVAIGAGRWRLVQLVLVESAWIALLAAAAGALFAAWSAPFVVGRIDRPESPARLLLPADWRVLGFGLVLTLGVTLLFGLAPAWRASAVKPAGTLKGGEDPHSRRRLMHALIGVQAAFCVLVLFVSALFVSTFDRLSNQPTGFAAERILLLDTVAQRDQPPAYWSMVAEHLRATPGVEQVAWAGFPLLGGTVSIRPISIGGAAPGSTDSAYFLNVSPGWIDIMRIPLLAGRDFRAGDGYPGVAIVNQAFVKHFLHGENPLGKSFASGGAVPLARIVGVVGDARYRDLRGPVFPTAYIPFHSAGAKGDLEPRRAGTFVVRTSGPNPLVLASTLRLEVPRARPEFRVTNVATQVGINSWHTIRERLLAMLALFFGGVALLLAGIGLYGVLDYCVLQRRREIGIRMAVGAQTGDIVRRVTADAFSMVMVGALAGLALALASVRYIESLLYQVKATDLGILAAPSLAIFAAALLAALPAVIRAVRIDPVQTLRSE